MIEAHHRLGGLPRVVATQASTMDDREGHAVTSFVVSLSMMSLPNWSGLAAYALDVIEARGRALVGARLDVGANEERLGENGRSLLGGLGK